MRGVLGRAPDFFCEQLLPGGAFCYRAVLDAGVISRSTPAAQPVLFDTWAPSLQ